MVNFLDRAAGSVIAGDTTSGGRNSRESYITGLRFRLSGQCINTNDVISGIGHLKAQSEIE